MLQELGLLRLFILRIIIMIPGSRSGIPVGRRRRLQQSLPLPPPLSAVSLPWNPHIENMGIPVRSQIGIRDRTGKEANRRLPNPHPPGGGRGIGSTPQPLRPIEATPPPNPLGRPYRLSDMGGRPATHGGSALGRWGYPFPDPDPGSRAV